ncbi:MAG: hypothetical protein MJY63_02565 [Paludibacteraceae bacterium]|nr:hypothetical protein [Paludibacteraceae bacterium]
MKSTMKKVLVFAILLLNVATLWANPNKKIREFYNPETKHEIGIGIGEFTTSTLHNAQLFHDCDDDVYSVVEKKDHHLPAIDVRYFYKLAKRFKIGMDMTWQKSKKKYHLTTTEVPYFLTNEYDINCVKREIEFWTGKGDEEDVSNYLSLVPQIKLTLLNRQKFAIYQRYGVGVSFEHIKYAFGYSDSKDVFINPCGSLLGFEFGGSQLRGYFETLSLTPQGFIHGGLKYEF